MAEKYVASNSCTMTLETLRAFMADVPKHWNVEVCIRMNSVYHCGMSTPRCMYQTRDLPVA